MIFLRRLDSPLPCSGGHSCPAVLEMAGGDFAVIGIDVTEAVTNRLPATAGCGPDERVVRVPRQTLIAAKRDIPD